MTSDRLLIVQLEENLFGVESWKKSIIIAQNNITIHSRIGHILTHKQLEMHGCALTAEGTYTLVLKHQAIGAHTAGYIFIVLDLFNTLIKVIVNSVTQFNGFSKKDKLFAG